MLLVTGTWFVAACRLKRINDLRTTPDQEYLGIRLFAALPDQEGQAGIVLRNAEQKEKV